MSFYEFFIFFVKQNTAYEMRIRDWSADVCSSDLHAVMARAFHPSPAQQPGQGQVTVAIAAQQGQPGGRVVAIGQQDVGAGDRQIGRASWRESVCEYV